MLSIEDERTIVSNYTNILNINKIYDEQMERQKNFEIQTDKQETEMELQLRYCRNIIYAINLVKVNIKYAFKKSQDNHIWEDTCFCYSFSGKYTFVHYINITPT